MFQWTLFSAWPQKIDLAGMKAGNTEVGMLTVTFACDVIQVMGTTGRPSGPAF
jgi:hypothetical protein